MYCVSVSFFFAFFTQIAALFLKPPPFVLLLPKCPESDFARTDVAPSLLTLDITFERRDGLAASIFLSFISF